MKIYLVTREGPEWTDIIAAFKTKASAEKLAREKNELRKALDGSINNVTDRMSEFCVSKIEVQE